ncbi:4'-phosphopantetheinyl transferase [Janthinobacterium psychrotolerans]|uniref:4'-phosphopantetheinyl transferase n=1 Tax=Janthinobacterium psychrotolerans TaxID=1747903 RepID=A0A1A7C2R1_9BURK|nr:4'-phosphopantetheinyl transferase [Janthinobacterium psychrotolerans]
MLVIGIDAAMTRTDARRRIRLAVREAVAMWLDIDSVSVQSESGHAPRLLVAGRAAWLSISHDDGISLAAIGLHGPVGIDVMRVQEIDDWHAVATDYLGPQVAQSLAACPAGQRPLALAQAWTAREAGLKCLGRELSEWDGVALHCDLHAMKMPQDFAAMLATIPHCTD